MDILCFALREGYGVSVTRNREGSDRTTHVYSTDYEEKSVVMIPTMARSYCSVWIIDISRQLMIADKNMYTSVQDIDATYPQIWYLQHKANI